MKKSIRTIAASAGMAAAMGAFAPNANALNWVLSPDANATAFGVTVVAGANEVNFLDIPGQPQGIFGAGFVYTGSNFSMDFDSDLYTWDSYNAPGTLNPSTGNPYGGTGYWDAFIVTVSTAGYYWNTVGPNSDPQLPSASQWVWGGQDFADGVLESYVTAPGTTDTISQAGSGPFYVSVVLDTKTLPNSDTNHPSWGSFHVTPIPEPETYAMLLAGLGLMGLVARRRKLEAT